MKFNFTKSVPMSQNNISIFGINPISEGAWANKIGLGTKLPLAPEQPVKVDVPTETNTNTTQTSTLIAEGISSFSVQQRITATPEQPVVSGGVSSSISQGKVESSASITSSVEEDSTSTSSFETTTSDLSESFGSRSLVIDGLDLFGA